MQINLRQVEIEAALKQYVVQQGINLYGKEVAIAFTAGRKEAGITAEISIEDADIPGFEADAPIPEFLRKETPVLAAVVGIDTARDTSITVAVENAPTSVELTDPEPVAEAPVVEADPVAEAEPVKTTSLFG